MVEPPTDIGGHVAAFAWHPRDENTLLVAGNYGRWVTVSANQSPVSDISDHISQLTLTSTVNDQVALFSQSRRRPLFPY